MFPLKFNGVLCIVLIHILTIECSPTVGTSSISDKNRFIFGGLENIKDDFSKDWAMSNQFILSPEQQRLLEYKDCLEKAGENAMLWPYFIYPKQGGYFHNKLKKNSEMSRGMYNALNHMDMYNAGK